MFRTKKSNRFCRGSKGTSWIKCYLFYIIVDRAAEGENAVHFLNQVDEGDLMALMEEGSGKAQPPAVCTCKDKCKAGAVNTACPVCSVNMTECVGKEAVPELNDAPP
ncbi:MAG: DUF4366 domain-containing protein [Oscillospiraceae bacterium]|nr:DUF4366 domain-containing protein [Oscillospiraceae bacterium]